MVDCPHCASQCNDGSRFCAACGGELDHEVALRADPFVGRALPGGYRVQHLAGIGGMGRVYLAEQTTLGRTVAVKVIHPHLAGDEHAAGRFITEARASCQLHHPNSIAIYDFGRTDDGQLYLVMEYLRGKDLARTVDEQGPLAIERIVDIMCQVLGALDEAHELSIVHRDLKPENIVLEPVRSGRDFVKVVDYGLAKMRDPAPGAAVTSPGFVCGTPEYMSPEQGRGDPLDGRADLYSIGVILFQLLTGRLPFEAETSTRLLLAHLTDVPPDPRDVAPHRQIPDELAEITLQLLEKQPAARFATARDLSDALRQSVSVPDTTRSTTSAACPSCGARNATAQKFCGECGNPISVPPGPMSTTGASASTPSTPTMRRPSPVAPPPRTQSSEHPTVPRIAFTPRSAPALDSNAFVGRGGALMWLSAQREDARAMPTSARIVGESGAGKTRLLRELVTRCRNDGDVVVQIAPDGSGARVGGQVLRRAIRELGSLPSGFRAAVEWAAASVRDRAGLDELFGLASGVRIPAERRAAYAAALSWAIVRASARANGGVVVVAVDDLDELDGVTQNAIADVMAEPPLVRVLFVVAFTRDPLKTGPGPGELREIGPLPPELVRELLAPATLPEFSPMTPLHVALLACWMRETTEPPPPKLDALLAARIARLHPAARSLLQALSLLGDEPDVSLVHSLVEDIDVDSAAATLRAARLVDGWHVAHHRIRDVARVSMSESQRRRLHGIAFDHLTHDAPLEVRAHHAAEAGRSFHGLILLDELATARSLAGDQAGAIAALRAALDLARRELSQGDLDQPLAAMSLFARKLADALAGAELYNDAEGILREALDAAAPTSSERAHILATLARVAHARQNQHEAQGYIEQALRIARQSDARELVLSLETLQRDIA